MAEGSLKVPPSTDRRGTLVCMWHLHSVAAIVREGNFMMLLITTIMSSRLLLCSSFPLLTYCT
jgi:hypothetical protein